MGFRFLIRFLGIRHRDGAEEIILKSIEIDPFGIGATTLLSDDINIR